MGDPFRAANGQLLPGHPGLKPVGARSKLSKRAISVVNGSWDAVIQKLLEQSVAGDVQSAKLLASITLPAGLPIQIDATPEGLIAAIESGDLSASEMRLVAATLDKLQDLKELAVIRARLSELEAILADDK